MTRFAYLSLSNDFWRWSKCKNCGHSTEFVGLASTGAVPNSLKLSFEDSATAMLHSYISVLKQSGSRFNMNDKLKKNWPSIVDLYKRLVVLSSTLPLNAATSGTLFRA